MTAPAFVPGRGLPRPPERFAALPPPLDPASPSSSEAYREARALLEAGYAWEAHEVFEALWHAAGREGPVALLMKTLIKLCASQLKVREGRPEGAVRHATNAARHLEALRAEVGNEFCGLDLDALQTAASMLAARAPSLAADDDPGPRVVLALPIG